jgi:hypothetical protein
MSGSGANPFDDTQVPHPPPSHTHTHTTLVDIFAHFGFFFFPSLFFDGFSSIRSFFHHCFAFSCLAGGGTIGKNSSVTLNVVKFFYLTMDVYFLFLSSCCISGWHPLLCRAARLHKTHTRTTTLLNLRLLLEEHQLLIQMQMQSKSQAVMYMRNF